MIIYGVALLAICTLAGVIMGDMLGVLLGVKSNVGGVGIAMILLICARLWMQQAWRHDQGLRNGRRFWGAMYIPVVVAMAAQQNVVTARCTGGPVAVLAAIGSVVVCGCTIALISRTHKGEPLPDEPAEITPVGATGRRSLTCADLIEKVWYHNGLVTAFAFVGVIMWVSVVLSKRLTFGRIHGSAIAIVIGLVLAWVGGTMTGGQKGLADLTLLSGIGLMGGAMLRDFAIVATAFDVQATKRKRPV